MTAPRLLLLLGALAVFAGGCDTYGPDAPGPDPGPDPDPDPDPVEPGDPAEVLGCASTGDLALGSVTSGTLRDSDCTLTPGRFEGYAGGEYVDVFVLTTAGATALRLDLESTDFDAFLIVTDDEGVAVASNDDVVPGSEGEADTDSRVEITLAAGTYFVLATSFGPAETGAYTLTATSG